MNEGGELYMTEQSRQIDIQPKSNKRRNAGALAVAGLAIFVGGAAFGGGFNPDTKPSASPTTNANLKLATQRPSEAGASPMSSTEPSGTPEPSKSPEVKVENFTVGNFGIFDVLPGDIIAGDVAMSDSKDSSILPLFDQDTHKAADVKDNGKTALFVEVQVPGVIHAEWGASVTRGLTAEQKAEMLKLQTISKARAGFEKVDVVVWTGYNTTTDEAGFKADGKQGSSMPNPSESPMPGANLDGSNSQELINTILDEIHKGNLTPDQEYNLMQQLIACLCSCGTPSETPKPTPKPTPEVCVVTKEDRLFDPKKGPITVTTKGLVVRGDVFINGHRYFDDSPKTAAVDTIWTNTPHTYKISGKYAADVLWTTDCASKADWKDQVDLAISQVEASGRTLDKKSLRKS